MNLIQLWRFRHLWTTEKTEWVLVNILDEPSNPAAQAVWRHYRAGHQKSRQEKLGPPDEESPIFLAWKPATQEVLFIEDDDLLKAIIYKMLRAGVKVVDSLP